MVTKSILKNIVINDRKSAEMLIHALEKSKAQKDKEVVVPQPFYAHSCDIQKMIFEKK